MKGRSGGLVADFLDALAAERGASANTIEAYRRDLRDYEAYLGGQRTGARQASASHVRTYLAACSAEGLKAASLARRLSAIRQFHKHLYAEGLRRDDPTLAIEGPRRARPLPKIADGCGSRQTDRHRARRAGRTRPTASRASGRSPHRLSDRAHLRLRSARFGGFEPAEIGRAREGAVSDGPR